MKATPQTEYQTCSSPWKALPYTCALSSSHSLSQTTPDLLSFTTGKFSLFQNSLRAVYSVVHGSFHSARAFRDLIMLPCTAMVCSLFQRAFCCVALPICPPWFGVTDKAVTNVCVQVFVGRCCLQFCFVWGDSTK